MDTKRFTADAVAAILAARNGDTPGLTTLLHNLTHHQLVHVGAFLAAYAANKIEQIDSITGEDTRPTLRTAALARYNDI